MDGNLVRMIRNGFLSKVSSFVKLAIYSPVHIANRLLGSSPFFFFIQGLAAAAASYVFLLKLQAVFHSMPIKVYHIT